MFGPNFVTTSTDPMTFPIRSYDCPPGQSPAFMLEGLVPAPGTCMGMHIGPAGMMRDDRQNALACDTTAQARQLIDLLGLDKDEWVPLGLGQVLTGHRFAKAVVMYRAKESLVALEAAVEWIGHLRSKSETLVLV